MKVASSPRNKLCVKREKIPLPVRPLPVNQRRHPQVSYIREDWLLRQGHIVVLMVLRSGIEQPPKVLARSVAMERPHAEGFNRADVYVIDD
jgi:hypothetical protein